MMASVSLNINGHVHTLDVDPETPVLYVLSDDLQLRGPNTLPLGIQVPSIESVLINRPAAKASGAGETAITLVAAAIGNAIFDATGARIREVPFRPARVRAALSSRSCEGWLLSVTVPTSTG
jgi:aerobic-type carbon monoxide dehydrogenase small subunit (CoxS/CutS family)